MAEEKVYLTADESAMIDAVVKAMIDRRHELGLTQRAFAEQSGFSHSAIARMESGRQMPNLTTLARLLSSLGLTMQIVPAEDEEK